MEAKKLYHFTAKDVIAIIESGFKSNIDQISIGDLHLKYKSSEILTYDEREVPLHDQSDTPIADQAPSLDDGSLMITDPLKYEELQAMEG